MQFPNCTAKVILFFRVRKQEGKKCVFYNIVLEIKRLFYTCKQLKCYQCDTPSAESITPGIKKTNHRSAVAPRWLSPLNTFKQNEI